MMQYHHFLCHVFPVVLFIYYCSSSTISCVTADFIQLGTAFFRGVSGGERKRTSIGMELIIGPQVLFLDEPTTGLDAHTAASVMKLLKRYIHTLAVKKNCALHQI